MILDERAIEKKNQLLQRMKDLSLSEDTESAHAEADRILIEVLKLSGGYDSLIEAYENIDKWYA